MTDRALVPIFYTNLLVYRKVVKIMSPTPHTDHICDIKPPNSRETEQVALYPTRIHQ